MVIIWTHSTHGGCNWTPETLWSSQNMFQIGIITISEHQDIRIIADFPDFIGRYHPSIIDIWWCDRFSLMKRIHKKVLVTLFGRGGGGRWVLFDGEVRELRVLYTSTISRGYMKSQILSWVEGNQAFGLEYYFTLFCSLENDWFLTISFAKNLINPFLLC